MTVGLAGLLAIRIFVKLFCLKCCSVILSDTDLGSDDSYSTTSVQFYLQRREDRKHLLSRVEFIFIRKVILIILLMLQLFSIFIKYFK